VLLPCESWKDLVEQIDAGCSRLHHSNATKICGFRVSIGLVRLTRISHTVALATQLASGEVRGRLRVTLCLHSQFPRLHREWIETRLKRALTRKNNDPDLGMHDLCVSRDLFGRARAIGADEIEIVVITSPVIETGNDLDFDYAILDPVSLRAIIQSAGRVRRHRSPLGEHPNVLILGRSSVAMEEGRLAMPGVETRPAKETGVSRRSLEAFEGRRFRDLAGDAKFERISAETLLSGEGSVPLRDAESGLRHAMVDATRSGPLGKYISHLNARMNLTMTRTRKFRRSDTRDVLYRLEGERIENAQWRVDLAPGTRESRFRLAEENGLEIGPVNGEHLFEGVTELAWLDYSKGRREMGPRELRKLMQLSVADYGFDLAPEIVCTDFTGFSRGTREDLFCAFGKRPKDR
jgi:CRISPR-associated endonuclease/helicase Cas3